MRRGGELASGGVGVTHGLYKVTGRRQYRGHEPGTRFEARPDAAIQRAINRGDISLIEYVNPRLPDDGFWLPHDWPPQGVDMQANQEAPKGASSM